MQAFYLNYLSSPKIAIHKKYRYEQRRKHLCKAYAEGLHPSI